MTNKTPTADWPPIRGHYNVHGYAWKAEALEVRLRDTAAALRTFIDSKRETGWAISAGENAGPALNKALPNARAILAQLEKEGLT